MKRIKFTPVLIHVYMFMTVVSAIFLFQDIDDFLFELGASSWLIGIVAGGAEAGYGFVNVLLFLWGISLPVLLTVFYIMACKKRYIPFVAVVTADAAVVLFWTINRFVAKDMYAFHANITDAIVSAVFAVILMTCLCVEKRSKKTVLEDDEYEAKNCSPSSVIPLIMDLNQP